MRNFKTKEWWRTESPLLSFKAQRIGIKKIAELVHNYRKNEIHRKN